MKSKRMQSLYEIIRARLPDCRKRRGIRHRFSTIITIAVAAVLFGAKSYIEIYEWAKKLNQRQLKRIKARKDKKTKRYVPPSEPTIRRVIQETDAELLDEIFGEWLLEKASPDDPIAVDGKTIRGARREDGTKVHMMSAFLQKQGITVAQREVDKKTNEIPEFKNLLEPLDIEGRVVTADAMHTQRETARYVKVKKGADYVFIVKDNQKNLLEDIKALREEDFSPGVRNG